jgi:hypothetical protein
MSQRQNRQRLYLSGRKKPEELQYSARRRAIAKARRLPARPAPPRPPPPPHYVLARI